MNHFSIVLFPHGSAFALRVHVNPKAKALQDRTHRFYIRTIKLCERLPWSDAAKSIREQLLDSAGSTDSNYRAACRDRTNKEFIAKLGVAAEEANESSGWLQALVSAEIGDLEEAKALAQEADELTAIFVASQKTAKRNAARRRLKQVT